jgi:hypothetical protein
MYGFFPNLLMSSTPCLGRWARLGRWDGYDRLDRFDGFRLPAFAIKIRLQPFLL